MKVGSHRKRDRDIHYCPNERPHIALDTLESFPKHLHGETQAIGVLDIVRNHTEGEQNHKECTKATQRTSNSSNKITTIQRLPTVKGHPKRLKQHTRDT